MTSSEREFDLVLFGATGFTGRLVAKYLAEHAPAETRIALAGRSLDKLAEIRSGLPQQAADWPLIQADSSQQESLESLARRTKVLCTTVGPYAKYGLPVVQACAEAGTHYTDLSGEILFMRDSIDQYDETARRTGARIVHSCGFDSIPSEVGVLAMHRASQADGDGTLGETTMAVVGTSGGFSGGTAASLINEIERMEREPETVKTARDPYALSPDRQAEPSVKPPTKVAGVGRDDDAGGYNGPFIMAYINARNVRRSNALLGYAYGRDFRYDEVIATGHGPLGLAKASALAGAMGAGFAGLRWSKSRGPLMHLLPDPGEGPNEQQREKGFFKIRFSAKTGDGRHYQARVIAQGDPGYKATAMMLSEASLALALDEADLPKRAGVLTPATAIGDKLIERLRTAGMTIEAKRAD